MMSRIEELFLYLQNPALVAIIAFGIFSLTRLVTTDTFPLFEKIRNALIERYPYDGYVTRERPKNKKVKFNLIGQNYTVTKGHWFGELISCNWCAGFYVSLFAMIFLAALPMTGILILSVFAMRAIAGLIGSMGH